MIRSSYICDVVSGRLRLWDSLSSIKPSNSAILDNTVPARFSTTFWRNALLVSTVVTRTVCVCLSVWNFRDAAKTMRVANRKFVYVVGVDLGDIIDESDVTSRFQWPTNWLISTNSKCDYAMTTQPISENVDYVLWKAGFMHFDLPVAKYQRFRLICVKNGLETCDLNCCNHNCDQCQQQPFCLLRTKM